MYTEICAELGEVIAAATNPQAIQLQLILGLLPGNFSARQVLRLPEKYNHDRGVRQLRVAERHGALVVVSYIATSRNIKRRPLLR